MNSFKVISAFHPSEMELMSTRNFWLKLNCLLIVALYSLEAVPPHPQKGSKNLYIGIYIVIYIYIFLYIIHIYIYIYMYIYVCVCMCVCVCVCVCISLPSWNNTSYAICWDKFLAFLHQQKFTKFYWIFSCNVWSLYQWILNKKNKRTKCWIKLIQDLRGLVKVFSILA